MTGMADLAHVLSLYARAEAATAGAYSYDEDAPCGESIDHNPTDDGGECRNCGAEFEVCWSDPAEKIEEETK